MKIIKKKYHVFIKNTIFLSVLQIFNYAYPLLIYPLITRSLGPEMFGRVSFSMAITAYFMILIDYGFNFTATRDVSINRGSSDQIQVIYSSVTMAKMLLFLVSSILFIALTLIFSLLRNDFILNVVVFSSLIGQVFLPIWLFQGMEIMLYITVINVVPKIIIAVFSVLLINGPDDYLVFPLLNSISTIFSGLVSLIIVRYKFKIKFIKPSFIQLNYQLKNSWHVFISGALTSVYTTSAIFILGLYASKEIVGCYALAEKIVKVGGALLVPLNTALFPLISKMVAHESKDKSLINNNVLIFNVVFMSIVSVFVFFYAYDIIVLIGGVAYNGAIIILKILSPFPLIITVCRYLSVNYIISYGRQKVLPRIYFVTASVSVLLFSLLIPIAKDIGTAISILIIESLGMLLMTVYIYKQRLFSNGY